MNRLIVPVAAWIVLFSCNQQKPSISTLDALEDKEALIKTGAHLVEIMGCGDCHSPKVFTEFGPMPDTEALFSGYRSEAKLPQVDKDLLNRWVLFGFENTAAVGPWGISFAANITSDPSGIGAWSLDQFKRALQEGKYKGIEGSRELLPPMPWPNYKKLTEEEVLAIYTFLKSTKPIRNIVPAAIALGDL